MKSLLLRLMKLEQIKQINTNDKIDIISYSVATINNNTLDKNQHKKDGYIFTTL